MITRTKRKPVARPKAGRGRAGRPLALSREKIAAAAMALVDREGLQALSTRRLGEELGCEAMSIYHHFPSKAHLMDALVDLMLADGRVELLPEWDFVERLRRSAHGFRDMALKHPKFFPYFAVHRLNTRSGVAFLDRIIGILREAGFSDRDAATHFRTIGYYLTGAALDEVAGYAKGPSAAETVSSETIAASFKNLAAAAPFFQPASFRPTFETGLEMLLAEIQRAHQQIEMTGQGS
jgi:AcrR family transcriptional regulator